MHRRILAAITLGLMVCSAHAQDKVLRVVPHSNLSILDPIWTTQFMARNHGYMIYDTLFGTDEKNRVQPQMVDKWTVSPDQRLWTFTLRPGQEFHDGKPVTGEDVTASIERWGKRDAMGQKLMTFVERMDSPQAGTFRIFLREACGIMLEALGKPSSNVPFIMPKRVAETPADKQIEEHIGSGPYVFKRDEFKPGEKAVYVKNAKYVPRKETPSGTTGGKHVYVDRVEWNLALRDAQSQVNALANGEVDVIERPAFESYEQLKGIKSFYRPCASMFTCNTPYGSTKGSEIQSKSNMKKAQELVKSSGYDGTPVMIMKPTDLAAIQKLPDVAAQLLRQAGFKVDLQAMDWNTVVSRRAKKEPPAQGGWNIFCTAWVAPDIWNPLANAAIGAQGEKSWFGWPTDDQIEKLRDEFARATDEGKKKNLAEAIQARAFEIGTHAPLGEYVNPLAARKNISGWVIGPGDVYWNVKKTGD